jgi:small-conductance mechanosensitive channel
MIDVIHHAIAVMVDMLSGVFFLAEDAFRLGEYVEVGNIRGTVEGIAIRSLKLRHHRGAVHTLPFGQIPRITNYSRDWVIQKLPFHLPFDTDLAKVKRIVKRIGAELLQDPDLGKYFLQPLKMQGVRDMTHDSMIVGVNLDFSNAVGFDRCARPPRVDFRSWEWVARA